MQFESRNRAHEFYNDLISDAIKTEEPIELKATMAEMGRTDLFYLLVYLLKRPDIDRDFLFERVQEVEASPNGHLDLWAREHYKSTIITYGLTIQDIVCDANITIGLFSLTRPISKGFLFQIKSELEDNEALKECYPDVLYENPKRESPRWSLDDGLVVRRNTNPKESTVEAWGLVDAMPTSRHYQIRLYDDIIDERHVTNTDIIRKAIKAWELSLSLGSTRPIGRYPEEINIERYSGTRYHLNDPYREVMRRGSVIPRIHPGTDDGTAEGNPVLWTREFMDKKRRDMGSYTFGCLAANTQVLMADWTLKPIQNIQEGENVVGWTMEPGRRSKLVATKVMATQQRIAETIDITMDGGQTITSTPDHKWWTGRRVEDRGRKVYGEAGLNYHGVSALCKAVDISIAQEPRGPTEAAYLAGIFDGEGSISNNTIHITQCEKTNPKVCERIRDSLNTLGFKHSEHRPKRNKNQIDFYINGGRQERFRFLTLCDPAKRNQIVRSMFGTRYLGIRTREEIASITPGKRKMVYNIETETGNYIANGYCSKNCQILQDPTADEAQGFKEDNLMFWDPDSWTPFNRYLLCDPAGELKKENDYTVMMVIGLGSDQNYYWIDGIRDRLNLTQRAKAYMRFHRLYLPLASGYEKYGKDSDIEHINDSMKRENYRFEIIALQQSVKKNDRIRKLIPLSESHRLYIPRRLLFIDREKKQRDLTREFIDDEYLPFPVGDHDDMMDCFANILDPKLGAVFPKLDDRRKALGAPTHRRAIVDEEVLPGIAA